MTELACSKIMLISVYHHVNLAHVKSNMSEDINSWEVYPILHNALQIVNTQKPDKQIKQQITVETVQKYTAEQPKSA